jgi:hypothetical protein
MSRPAGKVGAVTRVIPGTKLHASTGYQRPTRMGQLTDQLTRALLADVPDSEVVVLRAPPGPDGDVLAAAWRAARDDAISAYEAWRERATSEAFLVYRAAADREDAAAAVLAGRAAGRRASLRRRLHRRR